jgi:hypothetical protein
MGAHAALDLLASDPRPHATVVLGSGRSSIAGPAPENLLVVVGEGEDSSVVSASRDLAGEVPGARFAQIEGANHLSILWFDDTVAETVAWLDDAFGIDRAAPVGIVDPRLAPLPWYLLSLPGAAAALGLAAGRIGPRVAESAQPSGMRSLAFLVAALVVAAPIALVVEPARFLGEGYDDVVSYLLVAGVLLYLSAVRERTKRLPAKATLLRLVLAGLTSAAGLFLLLAPVGDVLHRIVPTPGRAGVAAIVTPLLAPFFVRSQSALRRGPLVRGATASILGHVVVLVALAAGVVTGVFPGVVGLALPLLAGVFALVEVFGAAAYSVTRDGVLVGVVESVWVAGLVAIAMPLP